MRHTSTLIFLLGLPFVSPISQATYPKNEPNGHFVVSPGGTTFELSTDDLADPVDLPGFEGITRFHLSVENLHPNAGLGSLTLFRDTLQFDDTGRATRNGGHATETVTVRFRIVGDPDRDTVYGRLYEVELADGRWPQQLRFVRDADPGLHHRLIVQDSITDFPDFFTVKRALPLSGDTRFQDPHLLPRIFDLCGLMPWGKFVREVRLNGVIETGADLHFDEVQIGQLGQYSPVIVMQFAESVKFRLLDGLQPAGVCRVYALEPGEERNTWLWGRSLPLAEGPWTYTLVLDSLLNGRHRLVAKSDGVVRHVVPLVPADPDVSKIEETVLATLPPQEREIVEDWQRRYGLQARFRVYDGHIRYANVHVDGDADVARLANLTHVSELALGGNNLTDASLEIVARFENVRYLHLPGGHSSDGYRHLHRMAWLRELWNYHRPNAAEKAELQAAIPRLVIR